MTPTSTGDQRTLRLTAEQEVLLDGAAFLTEVVEDGCAEAAVRAGFERLRIRHPDLQLDLLVDEEAFDGSLHLDLLVRTDSGRTVSLAVSPAPGLPWPLRGVVRAREYDLLEVEGVRMSVEDGVACIDTVFDDRRLMRTLIDACIIRSALAEEDIELSAAQLQEAADDFRRARGLRTAAATQAWLDERGMGPDRFAAVVEQQVRVGALRQRVVGDRVDEVFAEWAAQLEVLYVAWVDAPAGEAAVRSAADELRDDPVRALVRARREGRAGELVEWQVAELPEAFRALAPLTPGSTVRVGEPPVLATVLDRRPAALDGPTRHLLERRLFDEWLAERRRKATVRWLWGNEARTRQAQED